MDVASGGGLMDGPEPGGLSRAEAALLAADLAEAPAERYCQAHLAALRVAAVILAVRAPRLRGRGPGSRNVWQVIGQVAPEDAEWAGVFATTQLKQQAVAAGATAIVTAREADDLARDARLFCDQVALWVPRAQARSARGAG